MKLVNVILISFAFLFVSVAFGQLTLQASNDMNLRTCKSDLYTSGDHWCYGTSSHKVYSDYNNPKEHHRSSVENAYGEYDCDDRAKGTKTHAEAPDTMWVDHSYYGIGVC
ncbi:MAG: lactococcin 972 family bacteriocin [Mycoplasmatales bacterium]